MLRSALILLGIMLGLPAVATAAPLSLTPPETLCGVETLKMEQEYGIPEQLLHAISLMESGRYQREHKQVLAWPWTVMAEGRGRYFETKAEAIAEVKALKAKGVTNIDVGCMQINLKHHPKAFDSLEEAFEPASNVAYAARFLVGLFQSTQNWLKAGSYYHSQTPDRASAYRARLEKVWKKADEILSAALTAPPKIQQDIIEEARERDMVRRQNALEEKHAQQAEARAIAEAWRQAKLVEYSLRREKMQKARTVTALNNAQ